MCPAFVLTDFHLLSSVRCVAYPSHRPWMGLAACYVAVSHIDGNERSQGPRGLREARRMSICVFLASNGDTAHFTGMRRVSAFMATTVGLGDLERCYGGPYLPVSPLHLIIRNRISMLMAISRLFVQVRALRARCTTVHTSHSPIHSPDSS